jgi:putative membrane protein insertion efficiency factor
VLLSSNGPSCETSSSRTSTQQSRKQSKLEWRITKVAFLYSLWLAPRNLVVLFLKFYRKAISPLYGDVCRYYPSCSAYGLESVQQRGVVVGVFLTTWRVLRCNPWSQGGVDRVRPGSELFSVNKHGFVIPTSKKG